MQETSGSLVARLMRSREFSPSGTTDSPDSVGVGPLVWVRVPDDGGMLARSLGELNLHAATGATVAAIARDGHGVALPGGGRFCVPTIRSPWPDPLTRSRPPAILFRAHRDAVCDSVVASPHPPNHLSRAKITCPHSADVRDRQAGGLAIAIAF
jgi:hypothetical protein